MLARFRPQTPTIIETQAEIEKLLEIPNIQNKIYFDYLRQRKADLVAEKRQLASSLRAGDISLIIVDAKITRADSLLKKQEQPRNTLKDGATATTSARNQRRQ